MENKLYNFYISVFHLFDDNFFPLRLEVCETYWEKLFSHENFNSETLNISILCLCSIELQKNSVSSSCILRICFILYSSSKKLESNNEENKIIKLKKQEINFLANLKYWISCLSNEFQNRCFWMTRELLLKHYTKFISRESLWNLAYIWSFKWITSNSS